MKGVGAMLTNPTCADLCEKVLGATCSNPELRVHWSQNGSFDASFI